MSLKVYFVRHGESVGNANEGGESVGDHDKLTEKGWQQARNLGKRLQHEGLTHIVSSHYRRAQETATAINEVLRLPLDIHPGIHEHAAPTNYFSLPPPERLKGLPQFWMPANAEDPDHQFNGAESFNQIIGRVQRFQSFLAGQPDDKSILVVTHGHFLRFFLGVVLLGNEFGPGHFGKLSDHAKTVNTGISIFQYIERPSPRTREAGWRLITWMDQAHL